ncbi:MAG: hypothetical protein A2020_00940 [Lentisphaerae bacterium GWF2_45_14]|nr:MAG: hypothetical protein A2020_00940 [Lentisphaerae bacterium GWF2_45_14]
MKKLFAVLIILYLVAYIIPLGMRPLIVPDETRYSEISREMISSGNWTSPRLNGMVYFEKPVMGYWLNALSMLAFGENEFAARFPTALAAGISAILVFLLARLYTGNPLIAISASAIYLSFIMVFLTGIFNVLDSMFSCAVCAALFFFFRAYIEKVVRVKVFFLIFAGASAGAAFLIKGPLGFLLPAIVIAPFLLWEKKWKELLILPWLPALAALAVAAPWAIAVHYKEPDFWSYFLWVEHFQRYLKAGEYQHSKPFAYFIPLILGGALPWTFLAPAAFSNFGKNILKNKVVRYCVCWILIPFCFFSLSSGKLATYILPCFPPLAVLTATGLWSYFGRNPESKRKLFNCPALSLSIIFGAAALLFTVNQLTGFPQTLFRDTESWKWPLVTIAAASWAFFLYSSVRSTRTELKIFYFAIAPLTFMIISHLVFPDRAAENKAPGAFLIAHKDKVAPETIIVTYKNVTRAACWYYKRNDCFIFMEPGEFEYPLSRPENEGRFIKKVSDLNNFIKLHSKKQPVMLVMRTKIYREDCEGNIPPPDFIEKKGEFTIAFYKLKSPQN